MSVSVKEASERHSGCHGGCISGCQAELAYHSNSCVKFKFFRFFSLFLEMEDNNHDKPIRRSRTAAAVDQTRRHLSVFYVDYLFVYAVKISMAVCIAQVLGWAMYTVLVR